jgi:hypothetical protein
MGVVVTPERLKDFFEREPAAAFVIEGIVETEDTWYVGQVGIHKLQPLYRFAYFGQLSPSSSLHTVPFEQDEVGFAGIAIVFHQFDSSKYSDVPSEEFAGWVPVAMRERAEAWVKEGNERIREHLANRQG